MLNFVQFTDEFSHMFLTLIFITLNIKNTLIPTIYLYSLHSRLYRQNIIFDLYYLTNTQNLILRISTQH
ncbi:hypothetical protein C7475_1011057 [Chitinophaga sp. S165]|nr:hypothetical protein C7475_1011057 [Chitinophaga sp. S165]